MTHSFSDVARLFGIQITRLSFSNGAKPAMSRANIAAEHESCGAVSPAFEDVWAAGLLTNRMEVQAFDQLQHLVLICRIAQADAQPFRFWLTHLLIVADYTKLAGQLVYLCKDFTCFEFRKGNRRRFSRINADRSAFIRVNLRLKHLDRCCRPRGRRRHVSRRQVAS